MPMTVFSPSRSSESFENMLDFTERVAKDAVAAGSDLVKVAKDIEKAAGSGDLLRLHRGLDRLTTAVQLAAQAAANLTGSWSMGPSEEEELLRTSYEDELVESAKKGGCDIRRIEGRLVSFPTVIRVMPAQRVLQLNRTRMTALRPSVVVAVLKTVAARKPKQTPERFIEVLYGAYRLVAGADNSTGTTLSAIHDALTLMPDVRRDYGPAEFARDLYELDRSRLGQTKSGARISFPASTGTKGGGKVFSFVTPTGEPVSYYAIRFAP
jgi:hypothetical protein